MTAQYHVVLTLMFFASLTSCYKMGRKSDDTEQIEYTKRLSFLNFCSFHIVLGLWAQFFSHNVTETLGVFFLKLIACRVFADIWFYAMHRLMHTRPFYRFHKIHHEWKQPVSYAALYAHPIENILCNMMIVILPLHFLQASHFCTFFWTGVVMIQAILSHSGDISVFGIRSLHDHHHEHFDCEFGNGLFMDRLFRTRVQDKHPQVLPPCSTDNFEF